MQMINQYPVAPTVEHTNAIVILAAMHNEDLVGRVINVLTSRVVGAVTIVPATIAALTTAIRLATDAARGTSSYQRRQREKASDLAAAVVVSAAGLASEVADTVGVGIAADLAVYAVSQAGGTSAGVTEPGNAAKQSLALTVLAVVRSVVAAVAKQLKGVGMSSESRNALMYALCRLLDSLVDVVASNARDGSKQASRDEGLTNEVRVAVSTQLTDMFDADANKGDLYAERMVGDFVLRRVIVGASCAFAYCIPLCAVSSVSG